MKNRTIKFRIWNTTNKCFYTDDHVKANFFNYLERTEEPIMQFTGLLDKTGKEIYEGDIVKVIVGGENYKIIYKNYPVVYEKNGFYSPLATGPTSAMEVVGNIYENPNLYEKG